MIRVRTYSSTYFNVILLSKGEVSAYY